MKNSLLTLLLAGIVFAASGQIQQTDCRRFEEQIKPYNDGVQAYNLGKISYASFLKISEKVRVSLKACIINGKDQMGDQEYYSKMYLNGLLLMNTGKYTEAASFFKQVASTHGVSYEGHALETLAKNKEAACIKFEKAPEQGRTLYATISFRGKGSYMKALHIGGFYKKEIKQSTENQPYLNFEIDSLARHNYALNDQKSALSYFGKTYGEYNNSFQKDYTEARASYEKFYQQWVLLKQDMLAYLGNNKIDSAQRKNARRQVDDEEAWIKERYIFFTANLDVSQQLNLPFLFIPGPGYFDVNEINRNTHQLLGNPFRSIVTDFPDFITQKSDKLLASSDSLSDAFKNYPLFGYWNNAHVPNEPVRYRRDPDINDYAQTVGNALTFYQFLLHYFFVQRQTSTIIPIYLCGRNITKADYLAYSDLVYRVTRRHAAGKPGMYNEPTNSILFWAASGSGTLNHEMFHSVVEFDYPDMPHWLNEGIASMFEQSEFSTFIDGDSGKKIFSVVIERNFREEYIDAYHQQFKRDLTISQVMDDPVLNDDVAISIKDAYDRYFCKFLYENNYLAEFYQALRDHGSWNKQQRLNQLLKISHRTQSELDSAWYRSLGRYEYQRRVLAVIAPTVVPVKPNTDTTRTPATAAVKQGAGQGTNVGKTNQNRQLRQQQQRQETNYSSFNHFWSNVWSIFRRSAKKTSPTYYVKKEVAKLKIDPFASLNQL